MRSLRNFPVFLLLLLLCAALLNAQSDSELLNVTTIHPTLTTIDVPGAGYTNIFGINTLGEVVGNYGTDTNLDSHGFLYSNGTFTYFDYPSETVTVATGINDSGLISGYAGQQPIVGFVYDGSNFTTIKHGSDSATPVLGINNAGELIGGTGSIYSTKGFALPGNRFKLLNVLGVYTYIYGSGVNKSGTIVGWTDYDGFLCRGAMCQTLDFPGAAQTEARGINDAGMIVGWYGAGSRDYAFVEKGGKYLSFSYPGAAFTGAIGINNSGQIAGAYTFDYVAWHGFVTSPVTASDFAQK